MPEAKRTHGQARPSYGPGVPGTGVFGNPRVPSHRSFRSRLRNADTERRPKSAGYESSGERSSSSTRKDRPLPGRHPFRRRVRLADSPRKGRLRTRVSEATDSRFRFFPSQTPLTPKTGERKTAGHRTRLRTGTNRDSQPTGKNRAVGQPSDRNEQKWQNKNRLGRQAVPSRRTDTPFRKEAGRALRHETWIVYKQAPGRG